MGHLFYGNSEQPIFVPDRVLAHVKVVVATKLRRLESFTISWQHPDGTPRGRSTIWMHPSIPLRFVFDTAENDKLDRDYLHKLALAAGSTGGIIIDFTAPPEPAEAAASQHPTAAKRPTSAKRSASAKTPQPDLVPAP